MYELTPYDVLTERVRNALERRKSNPCFRPGDIRIDNLLTEDDLEEFDDATVVRVAAEQGLQYFVCAVCEAHPEPRVRANGKWVDPTPEVLEELRRAHPHQAYSLPCPSCIGHHVGKPYHSDNYS
jgi:hypothetical protein